MKEYYLAKYKRSWAIFGYSCKCPIIFGKKKDLIKRLNELNNPWRENA